MHIQRLMQHTLPTGDFADDFHVFGLFWNKSMIYTYIDDDSKKVLLTKFDQPFWNKGGWSSNIDNPWTGGENSTPFDQSFYIIMNVAVGGTNGYFPDGVGNKPWSDKSPNAPNQFWGGVNTWLPSWKGENAALQVDWIKVWQ